jgi:hypothetical protein
MKANKSIGNARAWRLSGTEVAILIAILSMYSGLVLAVLGKVIH